MADTNTYGHTSEIEWARYQQDVCMGSESRPLTASELAGLARILESEEPKGPDAQ